jgi:hypothetical protein
MKLRAGIVVVFALLMAAFLASCAGREPDRTAGAGAVFDLSAEIIAATRDTIVDIGRVRAGEVVRYDARLRNAAAEPLVVKGMSASCGCTSVEYDRQPIAPGDTGDFSFRFDSSGMWGTQMKLIEIRTSLSPRTYKLLVRAEVSE